MYKRKMKLSPIHISLIALAILVVIAVIVTFAVKKDDPKEPAAQSGIVYDDEIICIAILGLWNGNPMAYKRMHTNKVSECLHSLMDGISEIEFFVDERGDFRAHEMHHDGTNSYLYRVWKDVSVVQKENFLGKVYRGVATRKDITRYTRKIGADIAKVYGW